MNRIITLTSTVRNDNNTNIKVRIFVDSIGQYWRVDDKYTYVRFKDGGQFKYIETLEEIDKMLGIEEPVK